MNKIFFITAMLLSVMARAQDNSAATISGKVIDSVSSKPIEYATISLQREDNGKTVNGTTTNDKGFFMLGKVSEGVYKLTVYFIGYKTIEKKNLKIQSNQTYTLSSILLSSSQSVLKEVEITTDKSLIENKIDKMIYNAEKDLTAQGGVASDILKKIPQVSVDVNGNVELQGNSNIRFLINGKPSSMFGNNVADVLKSIPANQIQSIEVITSPGAKYDAEGGGIINIILKKVTAQGINGNLALTIGSRLENGALNLSAKKNKIGLNTFFSGSAQLLSTTLNSLTRTSSDITSKQNTGLYQNGQSNFDRGGYQTGISFDWDLNYKNSISAGVTYNYIHNQARGDLQRQILITDAGGTLLSNDVSKVLSANIFNGYFADYNLNYKKTFKKEGQELDLLFTASIANNQTFYSQSQMLVVSNLITSASEGNNPGKDKQLNASLNYVHPFTKTFNIETGLKAVMSDFSSLSNIYLYNNSSNDFLYNSAQSNQLGYKRDIYAGYISSTLKLFNYLDVKAGCRIEETSTGASYTPSTTVSIQPYNTLVPSITIGHTFKSHQTLKLAYSKRISRPSFRDINPFVNASDPKNITAGNPNLKPQFSENFELAFSTIFSKGNSLSLIGFFKDDYQDIQSYSRYYDTYKIGDSVYHNVAINTRENIGKEYNSGITVSSNIFFNAVFSCRTNISAFYRSIKSIYTDGSISGFMYRMNVTASFQFSKTLAAEIFGNFNSPRFNVQGVQPTFTTYNIAIRKMFLKNNASIAITATNPFDKYVNQRTSLNGNNFSSVNLLELPYRSFGINFTYKFGKIEFKKQKEIEDVNLTNPTAPGNNN